MHLIRTLLVFVLLTGSARAGTFFSELEDAYLAVLEQIVRWSPQNTNAYSISIADRGTPSGKEQFYPLPGRLWDRLRPRLEAKGINVAAYVTSDKLRWEGHRLVLKSTRRPAWIYAITGVRWRGDGRLYVSQEYTSGRMTAQGFTVIIELRAGQWVVVGTTDQWYE